MKKQVRAMFDGSCWPNPHGRAQYGFVVYVDEIRIHDGRGLIGHGYGMTNNVAEAAALSALLDYLIVERFDRSTHTILIQGDSRVVINVAKGNKKNPKGFFVEWALSCRAKLLELQWINEVKVAWVPREMNGAADELASVVTD